MTPEDVSDENVSSAVVQTKLETFYGKFDLLKLFRNAKTPQNVCLNKSREVYWVGYPSSAKSSPSPSQCFSNHCALHRTTSRRLVIHISRTIVSPAPPSCHTQLDIPIQHAYRHAALSPPTAGHPGATGAVHASGVGRDGKSDGDEAQALREMSVIREYVWTVSAPRTVRC